MSLRHTLVSLFSCDVAALISACEKPVSDDINTHEASIPDNFSSFHGPYLCHVCVCGVFFSLSVTHALVNTNILEYTDIHHFLLLTFRNIVNIQILIIPQIIN